MCYGRKKSRGVPFAFHPPQILREIYKRLRYGDNGVMFIASYGAAIAILFLEERRLTKVELIRYCEQMDRV